MKPLRVPLRVVFYKDGQDWIAHCLEFDLMGDGPTRREALDRMVDAISIQAQASIENNNPENLFKPADAKYFMMFAAGKDVAGGELHIKIDSVTIEDAETREYTESDSETDSRLACV
jgi:predicted RNase H-like HicB family nuclease